MAGINDYISTLDGHLKSSLAGHEFERCWALQNIADRNLEGKVFSLMFLVELAATGLESIQRSNSKYVKPLYPVLSRETMDGHKTSGA